MSSTTEPTRESAANEGGQGNLAPLPTPQVVGDLLDVFAAPSAHHRDDVRRIVEAALVLVRTRAFADGQAHVRQEVRRALGI